MAPLAVQSLSQVAISGAVIARRGDGDTIADGRGGEGTGLQEVMDDAFHRRGDAYPRGSSEHKEFVPKLAKAMMAARRQSNSIGTTPAQVRLSWEGDEGNSLGLPSAYDSRYRVHTAVLVDPQAVKEALRSDNRIGDAGAVAVAGALEPRRNGDG
eukprot:CAMPEP_0177779076 /NCGR_PEP_ID=MMETSP0491_2-20121128/16356_1 /TAXON_ID=63592 /ORGANISM="Tetraselmis chuii, Strain PLY429" /LENGTH=154 /DNA_ID=CAMNT_0019298515 /DNA_START=304 /DNA_END=766 /DNA_ORIENTATION=+